MTARFVPILILVASLGTVPAFAQEVATAAPQPAPAAAQTEAPAPDGPASEDFTGGVGKGQDGGSVVIQQQVPASSAGTPNVASAGRYVHILGH